MKTGRKILVSVLAAITVMACVSGCSSGKPAYENTQQLLEINDEIEYSALATEFARFDAVDTDHHVVQGGWYDGEYFYVCMYQNDNIDSRVILTKIDKDGKIVRKSGLLDLDHANNLTYNSKINKFVVSHCQCNDEDRYSDYSFVDPVSFKITQTGTLSRPFFSMAYCAAKDMYASGEWAGGVLDIWDGDLNVTSSYDEVVSDETTSQGVFADEEHIWFVRSGKNGSQPQIRVYDWQGNLRHVIEIYGMSVEPESITIVNGEIYVICNNEDYTGGIVYSLRLLEAK